MCRLLIVVAIVSLSSQFKILLHTPFNGIRRQPLLIVVSSSKENTILHTLNQTGFTLCHQVTVLGISLKVTLHLEFLLYSPRMSVCLSACDNSRTAERILKVCCHKLYTISFGIIINNKQSSINIEHRFNRGNLRMCKVILITYN